MPKWRNKLDTQSDVTNWTLSDVTNWAPKAVSGSPNAMHQGQGWLAMETLEDNWKCERLACNITLVWFCLPLLALQSSKWNADFVVC